MATQPTSESLRSTDLDVLHSLMVQLDRVHSNSQNKDTRHSAKLAAEYLRKKGISPTSKEGISPSTAEPVGGGLPCFASQADEANYLMHPFRSACLTSKTGKSLDAALTGIQVAFAAGYLSDEYALAPPTYVDQPKEASWFPKFWGSSRSPAPQSLTIPPTQEPTSATALGSTEETSPNATGSQTGETLADAIVVAVIQLSEQQSREMLHLRVVQLLETAGTSAPLGRTVSRLLVKTLINFTAHREPSIQEAARSGLAAVINANIRRMEQPRAKGKAAGLENAMSGIIEAICKSIRTHAPALPTDPAVATLPASTPEEQRIRTLVTASLSLMLQIVVNGGPTLRSNEQVIGLLRSSFTPCFLETALLPVPDVYRLSLSVFLALMGNYRKQLRVELGLFFRHVLFHILETATASQQQRSMVVEALRTLSEEPTNLIDIFLNYDCDSANTTCGAVFDVMIQILHYVATLQPAPKELISSCDEAVSSPTKLERSLSNEEVMTALDTQKYTPLCREALCTLLCVIRAQLQWIDRFEASQKHVDGKVVEVTAADPSQLDNVDSYSESEQAAQDAAAHAQHHRQKKQVMQVLRLINDKKDIEAALRHATKYGVIVAEPQVNPQAEPHISPQTSPAQQTPSAASESPSNAALQPQDSTAPHDSDASSPLSSEDAAIAKAFARFMYEHNNTIDRVAWGEFLSRRKSLNLRVLEEWTALHDVAGKSLDEALRDFLGDFKLVGEAQVVDRTMELFAQHYCLHNPDVFSSATTAFVLCFSICMLNTDAHSPNVHEKMTKAAFIRNNRGVSEGNDVDPEILSGIYTRIVASEIKLKPSLVKQDLPASEVASTHKGYFANIPVLSHIVPAVTDVVLLPVDFVEQLLGMGGFGRKPRDEKYSAEFKAILADAMATLVHAQGEQESTFTSASSLEQAILMWVTTAKTIGSAFVYALELSVPLCKGPETEADREYFNAALEGTTLAIRVCQNYGTLATASRLTQALLLCTNITQAVSLQKDTVTISGRFHPNNVECMKTLLTCVAQHGAYLDSLSWEHAFTLLSYLEACGIVAGSAVGSPEQRTSRVVCLADSVDPSLNRKGRKTPSQTASVQFLADWQQEMDKVFLADNYCRCIVDRLFDVSSAAESTRVVIVKALCNVCHNELKQGQLFALQHLSSMLLISMHQITRVAWQQMWRAASTAYSLSGTTDMENVTLYTIDALKQIAYSFLPRPEPVGYHYQREVLRPLTAILSQSSSITARHGVIAALQSIVEVRAPVLSSGWGMLFDALSHAALFVCVVDESWVLLRSMIDSHIQHFRSRETYRAMISCLVSFSCTTFNNAIAIMALEYLAYSAECAASGLRPLVEPNVTGGITKIASSPPLVFDNSLLVNIKTIRESALKRHTGPQGGPWRLHPEGTFGATAEAQTESKNMWLRIIESYLPAAISHPLLLVRLHAVASLCGRVLLQHGQHFPPDLWTHVFDDVLKALVRASCNEAGMTTYIALPRTQPGTPNSPFTNNSGPLLARQLSVGCALCRLLFSHLSDVVHEGEKMGVTVPLRALFLRLLRSYIHRISEQGDYHHIVATTSLDCLADTHLFAKIDSITEAIVMPSLRLQHTPELVDGLRPFTRDVFSLAATEGKEVPTPKAVAVPLLADMLSCAEDISKAHLQWVGLTIPSPTHPSFDAASRCSAHHGGYDGLEGRWTYSYLRLLDWVGRIILLHVSLASQTDRQSEEFHTVLSQFIELYQRILHRGLSVCRDSTSRVSSCSFPTSLASPFTADAAPAADKSNEESVVKELSCVCDADYFEGALYCNCFKFGTAVACRADTSAAEVDAVFSQATAFIGLLEALHDESLVQMRHAIEAARSSPPPNGSDVNNSLVENLKSNAFLHPLTHSSGEPTVSQHRCHVLSFVVVPVLAKSLVTLSQTLATAHNTAARALDLLKRLTKLLPSKMEELTVRSSAAACLKTFDNSPSSLYGYRRSDPDSVIATTVSPSATVVVQVQEAIWAAFASNR